MIKKGQVLKSKKDGNEIEILEVLGSITFYKVSEYVYPSLDKTSCIEENYIIPAEKWVPIEDEIFFYVDDCIEVKSTRYDENHLRDVRLVEFGNCTKTREESELNAEKFKEIFKK